MDVMLEVCSSWQLLFRAADCIYQLTAQTWVYISDVFGCEWIKSAQIHLFVFRPRQLVVCLSGYKKNVLSWALSSLLGLDQILLTIGHYSNGCRR